MVKSGRYEAPRVSDYGTLVDMTSSVPLVLGQAGADLSFSAPDGGLPLAPAEAGGDVVPAVQIGSQGIGGESGSGGPGSSPEGDGSTEFLGGGGSGGAGHGGSEVGGSSAPSGGGRSGELPFTGAAAGAAAAAGAGLAASGAALRRVTRGRRI